MILLKLTAGQQVALQVAFQGGVFLLVIVVVALTTRHVRKKWRALAEALGLTYIRGSLFAQPLIKGYQHDVLVTLTLTGGHGNRRGKKTSTKVEALVPVPLPNGLQLSREDFWFRLGKQFGGEEIEIGDLPFDSAFKIRGEDVHGIRAFLNNPVVRDALLIFLGRYPDTAIDLDRVTISVPDFLKDAEKVRPLILDIVNLARALATGQGTLMAPVFPPPPPPPSPPPPAAPAQQPALQAAPKAPPPIP